MISADTIKPAVRDRLQPILAEAAADCRTLVERLGFVHFHLGLRAMFPPGIPVQLFLDGGPREFASSWQERFGEGAIDPLLVRTVRSTLPFDWRDLADPETLALLAQVGMPYGFTVPLHGPAGACGLISMGGSAPLPQSGHLREELFRQTHWWGVTLFDRLLRRMRLEFERDARSRLTPRQHLALELAASGHGLAQIAQRLSVQISTARYLVARAAEKLGVDTREEAIVRMTAMGWLAHVLYPSNLPESSLYAVAEPAARDGGVSRVSPLRRAS